MLKFKPWRRFRAIKDRPALQDFLKDVGNSTKETLQKGLRAKNKTGRLYGSHRASAPNEYPANKTGQLLRSIRMTRTANEVTTGTTAFYGRFLSDGTRKMRPRKMTREAFRQALPEARQRLRGFYKWQRQ